MNIELAFMPESQKSEDKVINLKDKALILKNKAKLSTVRPARVSDNADSSETRSSAGSAKIGGAKVSATDKKGHDFVGIAG